MTTRPGIRRLATLAGGAAATLLALTLTTAPAASANSFYRACGPNNVATFNYDDGQDQFSIYLNQGNAKIRAVLTPAQSGRGSSRDFKLASSFAFFSDSRSLATACEDSLYNYTVTCTHPNGKSYCVKGTFYS